MLEYIQNKHRSYKMMIFFQTFSKHGNELERQLTLFDSAFEKVVQGKGTYITIELLSGKKEVLYMNK